MAKKNTLNNIEKALTASELPMGEEVNVEIEEEVLPEEEMISVEIDEDGGATISVGGEEEDEEIETKHYQHLAEKIDEETKEIIVNDVLGLDLLPINDKLLQKEISWINIK